MSADRHEEGDASMIRSLPRCGGQYACVRSLYIACVAVSAGANVTTASSPKLRSDFGESCGLALSRVRDFDWLLICLSRPVACAASKSNSTPATPSASEQPEPAAERKLCKVKSAFFCCLKI